MLESLITVMFSTALGALAGFVVSRWKDQERNRERLEGVAGALWADLQRIREELGKPREKIIELHLYGSDPIPPEIHEWVRSIVPEVANIHPNVLLHCFHLERALHNHGVCLRALRRVNEALSDRRDQLEELEAEAKEAVEEDDFDSEAWYEEWKIKDDLKREIRNLGSQGSLWEHSAVESRKRAHSLMDKIDGHLMGFLPAEHNVEFLEERQDREAQVELPFEK